MKYDMTKKPTKGAERTLDALSRIMFDLLSRESFEKISVNELCQYSNYPRATFYNYFDDKYDLLNYCWITIGKQVHLEEYAQFDPEETLYIYFDRAYEFMASYIEMFQRILEFNPMDSFLVNHFRGFINNQMREIFQHCPCEGRFKIPYEIVADHYSNTLLLVLEWSFLRGSICTKAKAHEYLQYLLAAI